MKLQGPVAAVSTEQKTYDAFVKSISFDETGAPHWQLPDGWSEQPGGQFRYATIARDGADPPVEISVSFLRAEDPTGDDYLRANIERWRGQIGLSNYGPNWREQAVEAGELRDIKVAGTEALALSFVNSESDQAIFAAIIPRLDAQIPIRTTERPIEPSSPPATVKFTAPAEWQEEQPSQFQTALYSLAEGGQRVEISVSSAGGGLEANLLRWRNQIGLPPVTPDELTKDLEALRIGDRDARYVAITGASDTIFGAIVPGEGVLWFFKLKGDTELAQRTEPAFREFLETVEFVTE